MEFTCPISGIKYRIDTNSSISGNFTAIHPIFNLGSKALLNCIRQAQAIPEADNYYLLGLATFNLLKPKWITTVDRERAIKNIIPNFERMVSLIFKIDIENRHRFPQFVIDKTTNGFDNLPVWLDNIESVFEELKSNARDLSLSNKLQRLEAILIRYINSSFSRHQNRIANSLADWADLVCDFPNTIFYAIADDENSKTTTKEYWKSLIRKSFLNSYTELIAAKIDYDDFCDLVEYLEFNISHGSVHAKVLMDKVRKTKEVIEEFSSKPKPRIVVEEKTTLGQLASITDEDAIKDINEITQPLVDPGPAPKQKDFPNNTLYLRARLKWQSAKYKYNNSLAGTDTESTNMAIKL